MSGFMKHTLEIITKNYETQITINQQEAQRTQVGCMVLRVKFRDDVTGTRSVLLSLL